MLLILSARPVGEDIAMHYGRLPPSFLPLGNQRLFAIQAELAGDGACAITLEEDFDLHDIDARALETAGIEVLRQPARLSLTEAIGDAIMRVLPQLKWGESLQLLYGDTLVRLPEVKPGARDLVAVQETTANYQWAYVREGLSERFTDAPPATIATRQVVCGYFVFSNPAAFADACASGGNITDVLNEYDHTHRLDLLKVEDWYDFGHLPLYFQSKKRVMIKRVFNDIRYERHMLVKRSSDTAKMRAEAHWYESLPVELRLHVPRYYGRVERDHRAGYAIEYLYHPLLGDLAAYGALPLASWLEILSACFEFADLCHDIRPDPGSPEASPEFAKRFFDKLIVSKTWERIERYCKETELPLDTIFTLNGRSFPPLDEVIGSALARVPPTTPDHVRFWHGDLFYGNMFYDFTARRVQAIDPRGQDGDQQLCLYGDWRYDIAKLAHSVIGQYDKIILGRSRLIENGPRDWELHLSEQPHQAQIETIFLSQIDLRYGLGREEVVALVALLFFSMLPLHSDRPDLQRMMLANALRLVGELEEEPK